jgi:hypothetical protein
MTDVIDGQDCSCQSFGTPTVRGGRPELFLQFFGTSTIYGPTPFARHLIIDVRENHCSHISGLLVEDFFASWPRWLSALTLLIILSAFDGQGSSKVLNEPV